MRVKGRAEGEGERIPSRLHAQHRTPYRALSPDPETMAWAKVKSQMLTCLSHPVTPRLIFLFICQWKFWFFMITSFIKEGPMWFSRDGCYLPLKFIPLCISFGIWEPGWVISYLVLPFSAWIYCQMQQQRMWAANPHAHPSGPESDIWKFFIKNQIQTSLLHIQVQWPWAVLSSVFARFYQNLWLWNIFQVANLKICVVWKYYILGIKTLSIFIISLLSAPSHSHFPETSPDVHLFPRVTQTYLTLCFPLPPFFLPISHIMTSIHVASPLDSLIEKAHHCRLWSRCSEHPSFLPSPKTVFVDMPWWFCFL